MLERIEKISAIGLLHDVNGKPFRFEQTQLIYADNGRGKSTLASIFRSAATGDGSILTERKTIDREDEPSVVLSFGSGHKVKFESGAWSENRPELIVFDSDFIERNVHSGGSVTPGQRKNLLQFALGATAVQSRLAEEEATKKSSEANQAVSQVTGQLSGYHQEMQLSAFIKLAPIAEAVAQNELVILRRRLSLAKDINKVLARQLPDKITIPAFDLDSLFGILQTSLKDIEENAEKIVANHVHSVQGEGFESWISEGQNYSDGLSCPYCAQDTSESSLIRAYRTHFNSEYEDLKRKVGLLSRGLERRTGESVVHAAEVEFAKALAAIAIWDGETEIAPPMFDIQKAKEHLESLRIYLAVIIEMKVSSPLDSIGTPEMKLQALGMWEEFLDVIRDANSQIGDARTAIELYKKGVESGNEVALNQAIKKLERSVVRGKREVLDLISSLEDRKSKAKEADAQKKIARESLDSLMSETLKAFQGDINKILSRFGASFSIEKMDANFRYGLRSEYGINMRGKSISLDGPPRFATALSEGDKRTLAFAFFVATTLSNPELSKKIVIIDDPMCSLDANRRTETRVILKELASSAEQLIVLAHDPFFIREFRNSLASKDSPIGQVLRLKHALGGFTDLAKFDIDQECESDFYKHHRTLMEFCNGYNHDSRAVAKVIRPFLEGYLHRRFPGLLPKDSMFGQVLSIIGEAAAGSPLVYAHPLITELQNINSYAGKFHHDTNPDSYQTIPVVESELLHYGSRALNLVYRGSV